MKRLLSLVALSLCAMAVQATPDTTWMTVVLDGRKIGHLQIDREQVGNRVRTTQSLVLRLSRSGKPMVIESVSGSLETDGGEPLAFDAKTHLSSVENRVEGDRLDDERFQVQTSTGGKDHQRLLYWPQDALLAEGQRLAMQQQGLAPGTRYRMRNFDPATQRVINVQMDVMGRENTLLPGGARDLTRIRETLRLSSSPQTMDLWLDDDFRIRKGRMLLLGYTLEMMACSRACALAPNQDIDLLRKTMADSPRLMNYALRAVPMRYMIHIRNTTGAHPINTGEQHALRIGDDLWQVDIGYPRPGGETPPEPEDVMANDWLQSDAPEIIAMAKEAAHETTRPSRQMVRLKSFVTHYIHQKGLGVGYASALETLHTREGDCTEHALLLAALARALNIPARVVTGLVYADRFGGRNRVFIPHAWVQAWVDGRWQSYDAALKQFDSTHIALATSDGDPWKYFAGFNALATLRIDRATPISGLLSFPTPAAPAANAGGGINGH